jgi:hypothetical protein
MIGDLDGFFKSIEDVKISIRSAIHAEPKGEVLETFQGLLALIDAHKEKLMVEGPAAFQKAREKLAADKQQLAALSGKAEGLFGKIRELISKCDAVAENGRAIVESGKGKPIPLPNRPPKITNQKRPTLEFTGGDALRDILCTHKEAAKVSARLRTHGNIWENWAPVTPAARETEDDDLEVFDREEEDTN